MKILIVIIALTASFYLTAGSSEQQNKNTSRKENPMYNKLTDEEKKVIIDKGTERPFTGKFYKHNDNGVYICKQCGKPLYNSSSKFNSSCGWPSFDDEIKGAVKRQTDADGRRTEILCANCGGHLGHVFFGEGLTDKNTRHCVNSISLDFLAVKEVKKETEKAPVKAENKFERAIFASGCFWGTEYHLQRAPGVISTTVGYTGGTKEKPTYREVCTGTTGHAEAVEVIFDPDKTSYEKLAKLYFETHDPTQVNRQGPDVGTQYRSEIFYTNEKQKEIAEKLSKELKEKGYKVATKITKAGSFWKAEDYHQDYYNKTHKKPYCHVYIEKF